MHTQARKVMRRQAEDGAATALHVQELVEGREAAFTPRLVDVRDVAHAHILAAESSSAKGRYILCHSHEHEAGELFAALAARFPQYSYPSKPYQSKHVFDNSKVG